MCLWSEQKTSCLTTAFLEIPVACLSCVACISLFSLSCIGLSTTPYELVCVYMPVKRKCRETLQQVKERLSREQRLRTEKRIEELLEPERLAVIEDEAVSYDLEPHGLSTYKPKVAVSGQVILNLTGCLLWVAVLVYVYWFNRNHTCYRI